MLFGFIINTNQVVERVAHNTVNVFNRGWINEQIQVEANSAFVLTESEQNQQQRFEVSFKMVSTICFKTSAGQEGSYGHSTHPSRWTAWNSATKNLGKWVEDNSDFDTYLAEINKYRKSTDTEDINMDD